ncbi:hypothetical protein L917_19021 [Phytophthora nicotianae]|uniref:Uncharacterized protein n=1 Tax=Phytophthora nicotianae TaxID=4792 RepID=W2I185_PHYNI|nr:hypothetical protein L915_19301 [Phytophthora nicotianae]ETL27237.1 hypothetical protein L916_19196 [Phytophthora nicotianae]ETL80487.1 hypothetical protein L917_19021 [Phytophthora nicotianae]
MNLAIRYPLHAPTGSVSRTVQTMLILIRADWRR